MPVRGVVVALASATLPSDGASGASSNSSWRVLTCSVFSGCSSCGGDTSRAASSLNPPGALDDVSSLAPGDCFLCVWNVLYVPPGLDAHLEALGFSLGFVMSE